MAPPPNRSFNNVKDEPPNLVLVYSGDRLESFEEKAPPGLYVCKVQIRALEDPDDPAKICFCIRKRYYRGLEATGVPEFGEHRFLSELDFQNYATSKWKCCPNMKPNPKFDKLGGWAANIDGPEKGIGYNELVRNGGGLKYESIRKEVHSLAHSSIHKKTA